MNKTNLGYYNDESKLEEQKDQKNQENLLRINSQLKSAKIIQKNAALQRGETETKLANNSTQLIGSKRKSKNERKSQLLGNHAFSPEESQRQRLLKEPSPKSAGAGADGNGNEEATEAD